MIRRKEECTKEKREHMRGGEGFAQITNFIGSPSELNDKGRLFARLRLEPGCGIGYHVHENDAELFYMLEGTAQYSDNGDMKTIEAGDVTICPAGTGHSIYNASDSPVEFIALILYK